jgi:hypothetical protein
MEMVPFNIFLDLIHFIRLHSVFIIHIFHALAAYIVLIIQ